MSNNVLIGLPAGADSLWKSQSLDLIKNAIPDVGDVFATNEALLFRSALMEENFAVAVCFENAGRGTSYAEIFLETDVKGTIFILIVPDRCFGDSYLKKYVDAGINRILFTRDVNNESIRKMVTDGYASESELLEYLGMFQRPVKVEQPAEKSEPDQGTKVEKKYMGNGVLVTRLCGGDVKKLTGDGIGEDEILSAIISNNYNIRLDMAAMPYKEFELDDAWIEEYKNKIREYFRLQGLMIFQSFKNKDMDRESFEGYVIKELQQMKLKTSEAKIVCASFMKDILSYGKIDVVLNTPDVSDVRLMNKDVINVQYRGSWYRTNISFEDNDSYKDFIYRMCNLNMASINLHEPETIFTDMRTFPNLTLRTTVTHGMLNSNEDYGAHIRIATKSKKTVEMLIADGFMSEKQAACLIGAIQNKKSIIICGSSGSGKTILLNMLIEYFDPSICGICIQESDELHSESHRNIEFLHSITPKGEGSLGYSLGKLSTTSLLKNMQLFIIGEIKGNESEDFVTASRTTTVYATTHAEDFTGALPRIAELTKSKENNYPKEELLRMLSKNIGYVVYCEKYQCKQIARVVGYDKVKDDVIYDLYEFDAQEGE